MQTQDSGRSPSFSCYSSDSLTSNAIAKVIREENVAARFQKLEEDFEFLVLSGEEETNLQCWTTFPVFDRDLLLDEEVHHKNAKTKEDEIDGSVSITSSLQKLFIDDHEESSSHSSSEADELENIPSRTFCLWRPKAETGTLAKCKKSSSTGSSGSKKWKIRYSFKRSNSEGKEPMVLLTPNNKKIDTGPKQKRNSNKLKTQTPAHELFYVQRRAENEEGKKKSYLPYRKDLVGLFANVNGMGKMLPF